MSAPPFPPFPPRPTPPVQDDLRGGNRDHSRAPSGTSICPRSMQGNPQRTTRSILRPSSSYMFPSHNPEGGPQAPRSQALPIRPNAVSCQSHTYSSPEVRPHTENRARQPSPDRSRMENVLTPSHAPSHFIPHPRADRGATVRRRSEFIARVDTPSASAIRGHSASDVRVAHTSPHDLDPDRLARACRQPAPTVYRHDDRGRQGNSMESSPIKGLAAVQNGDPLPPHPPLPRARIGHMYRRLDALVRRSGRRAMDYIGFQDVAIIHNRDNQLREQLCRKRSERLREKDPSFHAIGSPLEDVLLYASTTIVIGDYEYHLPTVVVACVEELTKTGIYQPGLFRTLPSRDRHIQLIDLFDKSPNFGAQFNMRGQAMPDICALLSTFISNLPAPLLDARVYTALWNWSVKPSVKREDTRRDSQEEKEEERRARGEPPDLNTRTKSTDIYLDEADSMLETDQISIAQILLRFLPCANLSLLVYLCEFFTQLPLCPENELQLEDVARIFGHRLLGGSIKAASQRMMLWLLARWHRILETLFGDSEMPPVAAQTLLDSELV